MLEGNDVPHMAAVERARAGACGCERWGRGAERSGKREVRVSKLRDHGRAAVLDCGLAVWEDARCGVPAVRKGFEGVCGEWVKGGCGGKVT